MTAPTAPGGAPLVSLVLLAPDPADENPDPLGRTRASMDLQGEGPWELLVPPELESDDPDAAALLDPTSTLGPEQHAARGRRLAELAATARGTYVGVLRAGYHLEPGALAAVAASLAEDGAVPGEGVDLAGARPAALYTDEQWPGPAATGIAAKADFSPRHLEQFDSVGHLLLVRRDVLEAVGGLQPADPGLAPAASWDLRLRVAEAARAAGESLRHVPVLGIWRPLAPRHDEAYVRAGQAAVEAHLGRLGIAARVEPTRDEPGDAAGFLRVWREPPVDPELVSIVVPTGGGHREVRGRDVLLAEHTVASIADRTTYPAFEIVLVVSEGTDPAVAERCRAALERAGSPAQLRVVEAPGAFNFSRSINLGVEAARGELVLLLNDDVEVLTPHWLTRMVAVESDPDVGAVGAKLLFEDGRIQHVGIFFNRDGWVGHMHIFEPDELGPQGAKVTDFDVLAVTGACLLVRRSLFEEVGGFSESLPLNFNDVDFCLKLVRAGYVNVVTPAARLHHFESSTRKAEVLDREKDSLQWWRPRSMPDPNLHVRGVG